MSNSKYHYPKVEEIHVGYECEVNDAKGYKEDFVKTIVGYKMPGGYTNELSDIVAMIDDGYGEVRVPYLNKEYIEAEGWANTTQTEYRKRTAFEKGNFFLVLDLAEETPWINMIVKDPSLLTILNPEGFRITLPCPTINEFRTICKLLDI